VSSNFHFKSYHLNLNGIVHGDLVYGCLLAARAPRSDAYLIIALAGVDLVRSVRSMQIDYTRMNRDDFMAFFRDDNRLKHLTNDDRLEIFSQILAGSCDITLALLGNLLSDYSVGGLEVVETT
jgi:hypothetical protein